VRDGAVEHVVSYTSQAQNDQIIAVVETGRLGLELGKSSIAARAGARVELPVLIRRSKGLNGPVKVELVLPAHMTGVSAPAATVAADSSRGALLLTFGDRPGPFTQPIVIRATLMTAQGAVTAEAILEVVSGE
jgi:hypothetical protein